jgi:hypothetical protein
MLILPQYLKTFSLQIHLTVCDGLNCVPSFHKSYIGVLSSPVPSQQMRFFRGKSKMRLLWRVLILYVWWFYKKGKFGNSHRGEIPNKDGSRDQSDVSTSQETPENPGMPEKKHPGTDFSPHPSRDTRY